jgi:hypothetical protein
MTPTTHLDAGVKRLKWIGANYTGCPTVLFRGIQGALYAIQATPESRTDIQHFAHSSPYI